MSNSSISPIDRTLSEWTLEAIAMEGAPHPPKLQHYWNLTIRLFSVICKTLIGGGLTPLQRCTGYILQLQPTGQIIITCFLPVISF